MRLLLLPCRLQNECPKKILYHHCKSRQVEQVDKCLCMDPFCWIFQHPPSPYSHCTLQKLGKFNFSWQEPSAATVGSSFQQRWRSFQSLSQHPACCTATCRPKQEHREKITEIQKHKPGSHGELHCSSITKSFLCQKYRVLQTLCPL